jgi:hypothetical protein
MQGINIEAKINIGVRQGCNRPPALFHMYMEGAIKEIEEQVIKGIKVNREEINMLRFADDIAIVAGSENDLQNSWNTIEKVFQEYNMKINKKITKVLVCGRKKTVADVRMKRERLEQVELFTYLRSTIHIKRRIAQAKTAFMTQRPLLCSKSIRLETRKQYVKTFIWTVALYGSEARTMGKAD